MRMDRSEKPETLWYVASFGSLDKANSVKMETTVLQYRLLS